MSRNLAAIFLNSISVFLSRLPDWMAASCAFSEQLTTSFRSVWASSTLPTVYNWSADLSWRQAISTNNAGRSSTLAASARAIISCTDSCFEASARNEVARRTAVIRIWKRIGLFLRLDRDQAMPRLPLLIRILPLRQFKKFVIILCRHFIVAQVIVRAGTKKIADRNLG